MIQHSPEGRKNQAKPAAENADGIRIMKVRFTGASYSVSIPRDIGAAAKVMPGRFVDVRHIGPVIVITPVADVSTQESTEREVIDKITQAVAGWMTGQAKHP